MDASTLDCDDGFPAESGADTSAKSFSSSTFTMVTFGSSKRGRVGGWVVAFGVPTFTGLEVSPNQAGGRAVPIVPGAKFKYPRSKSGFFVKAIAGVVASGAVRFGWFATEREAEQAAKDWAASQVNAPSSTAPGSPSSQLVTIVTTANSNGNAFTLGTGSLACMVTNRGASVVYLGHTAAEATAANGAKIPSGQSLRWVGPLFWAADGAGSAEFLEDIA